MVVRRLITAILAVAVVSGGLAVAGPPPVSQAYTTAGVCHFPATATTMTYAPVSSTEYANVKDAVARAAVRWNSVAIKPRFSTTTFTNAAFVLYKSGTFSDAGTLAMTSGTCVSGLWKTNQVTVTFATSYFTQASVGGVFYGIVERRMIAAHELGHTLGLGEMNTGGSACTTMPTYTVVPSVMTQGGRKWSCDWGDEPWADDIKGVNSIYK